MGWSYAMCSQSAPRPPALITHTDCINGALWSCFEIIEVHQYLNLLAMTLRSQCAIWREWAFFFFFFFPRRAWCFEMTLHFGCELNEILPKQTLDCCLNKHLFTQEVGKVNRLETTVYQSISVLLSVLSLIVFNEYKSLMWSIVLLMCTDGKMLILISHWDLNQDLWIQEAPTERSGCSYNCHFSVIM